jgi:hypothetical protein
MALAEEGAPGTTFDVPRGCSTRAAWLDALRERLPPLLRTHPLLGTLSVHVARKDGTAPDGYVGELASSADAALGGSRAVRGATCDEVLDALGFIAALGLERAASSGASGASPEMPPRLGASGAAPLEEERAAGGVDERGTAVAPTGTWQRVRLGAVGFALLQDRLTPAGSVAFGMAFRFAWSTPGWQPWVMLGAYSSVPEQHRLEGGGRVRFEHWSTHAVACPLRFPRNGVWGLRPCLDLDLGRSSGEAFDVAGAEKHASPWLSGGAQLRAELVLWDRVELIASAGAVAPFWYAHYYLLPDVQSFTTPALGFRAGSYASVLF